MSTLSCDEVRWEYPRGLGSLFPRILILDSLLLWNRYRRVVSHEWQVYGEGIGWLGYSRG